MFQATVREPVRIERSRAGPPKRLDEDVDNDCSLEVGGVNVGGGIGGIDWTENGLGGLTYRFACWLASFMCAQCCTVL